MADLEPPAPRYHASGEHTVPGHDDWLAAPEADRLNSMRYTKRRSEARLGRWTAKHAVARAMGLPLDHDELREVVIRNAPDGAPEAFVGGRAAPVSISMTDRADWAVCVVAEQVEAVGCDLELVEPRSPGFVTDWFTPDERAVVENASGERDLLANLIWSAKESALKVLREGLRLDTRSVEVDLLERAGSGWRALAVTASDGRRFPGWWARFDQFVLTYCASEPTEAPVALDDPSPLADARPAHAWMSEPLREAGGA